MNRTSFVAGCVLAAGGEMNDLACPHCGSPNVVIVSSDERRELVTIRCQACGRVSEVDTEHEPVNPAP